MSIKIQDKISNNHLLSEDGILSNIKNTEIIDNILLKHKIE